MLISFIISIVLTLNYLMLLPMLMLLDEKQVGRAVFLFVHSYLFTFLLLAVEIFFLCIEVYICARAPY